MPTNVHLGFDDDDHREAVMERLRALPTLPDGELVEDDDGAHFALPGDDPNAAVIRAQTLVRGALDGTDIDPASVRLSPDAGWV
jgi:hypothetical protein